MSRGATKSMNSLCCAAHTASDPWVAWCVTQIQEPVYDRRAVQHTYGVQTKTHVAVGCGACVYRRQGFVQAREIEILQRENCVELRDRHVLHGAFTFKRATLWNPDA